MTYDIIEIMKHRLFRVDYKNLKDHVKFSDVAGIVVMAGALVLLGTLIVVAIFEAVKNLI